MRRSWWCVCVVLGCHSDWERTRAVYCEAAGDQGQLVDYRFAGSLAIAREVPARGAGQDDRRFATCNQLHASLEGTKFAIRSFEAGARGIVDGTALDDREPRFYSHPAWLAVMTACHRGDAEETAAQVLVLRDATAQRFGQVIEACDR